MKILLISHGSGPYGAERVLLELARRLASRGHDVTVSFPHSGPATASAAKLPGVTVRVGGRRRLPRTAREGIRYLLGGPADILAVHRLVTEVTPDLTWINSMYNPWVAIGARLAGSPTVWHLHERSMRGIAGWVLSALMALTADRAVAVSEYTARSHRRFPWLRRKVSVLYNPLVRDPGPRPDPSPDLFTVGYVGQLEPRKRVGDLVRAIGLLPENVRGLFIGGGKGRSSLEALIRRVGVENRIQLLGFRSDVPAQLSRFHCLAVPSVEEAFGLAALEGMASGLPVVAARSGALPEVLGNAALYHSPRSASELASQLDRLRADPDLRAELGARGRERADRFQPEEWIESAELVMSEVTSTRPHKRNAAPS